MIDIAQEEQLVGVDIKVDIVSSDALQELREALLCRLVVVGMK